MTGLWFSPGTPVSSINKTDRYEISEILLKVTSNTISLTLNLDFYYLNDTVHTLASSSDTTPLESMSNSLCEITSIKSTLKINKQK